MREKYLAMRRSGQIDMSYFYKYFVEKGGKLDFNTFQTIFLMPQYMNMALKHFDVGFQITILYNKNNQVISIN